jgi:hypothetical protein
MKGVKTCVLIFTAVLMVMTVQGAPVLPSEFFGSVTINGAQAQPGTVIKAVINGVERGSITTTAAGIYGGTGTFDQRLSIAMTEEELKSAGSPVIEFMVNGQKAAETATYQAGASSRLDLTISTTGSSSQRQGEASGVVATSLPSKNVATGSQSSSSDSGDFPTGTETRQPVTSGTVAASSTAATGSTPQNGAPVVNNKSPNVTEMTPGNAAVTRESVSVQSSAASTPGKAATVPVTTTKKSPVGIAALVMAMAGCTLLAGVRQHLEKD